MFEPRLYKPHWSYQKANPDCCNETVYDRWRIDVVGSQCSRKVKIMIRGVGYCRQHSTRYAKYMEGEHV